MNAPEQTIVELTDCINRAFELVDFPLKDDLVDGSLSEQDYGVDVATDLERWRSKIPDKSLLREMHQELRKLSPSATRWIVPHYLRYAVTNEAKYSRMETSFFVLSLIPRREGEDRQIAQRLSSLSRKQIECMTKVLEHLNADSEWAEDMGEDIESALCALHGLRGTS